MYKSDMTFPCIKEMRLPHHIQECRATTPDTHTCTCTNTHTDTEIHFLRCI